MAELMQPVVVKIGDGEPVTAQNPDQSNVAVFLGGIDPVKQYAFFVKAFF